jgi:hypothetical protein
MAGADPVRSFCNLGCELKAESGTLVANAPLSCVRSQGICVESQPAAELLTSVVLDGASAPK